MFGFIGIGMPTTGADGSGLFALSEYIGNGSSQVVYTGQNLAAGGIVLAKQLSAATEDPVIANTVWGITKFLPTNSTAIENDDSSVFDSAYGGGFNVGSNVRTNEVAESYLALSWAIREEFCDAVVYTGQGAGDVDVVAHGVGVAPTMMLIKNYDDAASSWFVYHSALGNATRMTLNTTAAATATTALNSTSPDSAQFTVAGELNVLGDGYVAYLFAEREGSSKFGSYTGDGTSSKAITGFGFTPKAILVRSSSDTGDWNLYFKPADGIIYRYELNDDAASISAAAIMTFDADGFTATTSGGILNGSGETYIYAAWG